MKTKMKSTPTKVMAFALIILTCVACNQAEYKEQFANADISEAIEESYYTDERSYISSPTVQQEILKTPKNLKIIKTATSRYKVDDVKKATATIKKMAEQYGAYISELQFNNTLYEKQNKFTVKVPNAAFDVMMDTIAGTATFIEFENITTKDVTEEFTDITARLKTKQAVKARYEEVLRKRAVTVEDILLTEDKLRIIQEEIEAAQGRLKYLSDKVAFSTIHIHLYETVNYVDTPESYSKTFIDKAKNGFSNGWSIVEVLILGIITLWPLFVFGVVAWLGIRLFLKKE